MDPIDLTPRRGGSGGDGNGGRSVQTSSRRRRHLTLSSPTGTELSSEFDAAADGPGSGSSSSSAGPDLEFDVTPYRRSRNRVPEDSPTENNLGLLLLVSPVRSPASTDDDVLIMDGVLVDSDPSTPSSARRSVSFVDDNGPSSRRSVSIGDLVLVSSDSQGSSGGGNGSGSSGGQVIVRFALMISCH